jgi:membrane protein implicated in regulation of membrane protease activity
MTELFEPDGHRQEVESDEEEQGSRDIFVLVFFFIVFAGTIVLLAHWLQPDWGWQLYTAILAGSYYATWLLRKFQNRG